MSFANLCSLFVKNNVALHAAFAKEKAARAKSFLEVTALWSEKAVWRVMIEEWTRRLEDELSAREKSVADKRPTDDALTAKKKLTEQVKQYSGPVVEMEGEVVKDNEAVADVDVKLKTSEEQADDVAYEQNGLQACLQQSQRGQADVCESVTQIQGAIDRFSAGLRKDRNYMDHRAD